MLTPFTVKAFFSRRNGLLSFIAFFISRAAILMGFYPCCFALFTGVSMLDHSRVSGVFFWSFLGLLSVGTLKQGLFYGLQLLVFYFLTNLISDENFWTWPPFLALLVTVGGGLSQLAFSGFNPPAFLRIGLEGLLVFILSMIFVYVLPVVFRESNLRGLGNEETVCLLILSALVMLGFTGLKFGPISLQQVFGRYLVMLMGQIGGAGMGAALGTTYGVVGMLSQGMPVTVPGVYAFCGLLAGAFRGLGKVGGGLSFLLGDLLLSLYILHTPDLLLSLWHCLWALAILFLTPSGYLAEAARFVPGTLEYRRIQEEYDHRVRQLAVERLTQVVHIFRELGSTMEEITATEQSRDQERLNQLFQGICHQVCSSCNLYHNCWEEEYYKTYRLIFGLLRLAENHSELTKDMVSAELRRRCVRLQDLVSGTNHLLELYRLDQYWQQRLKERSAMVSNQLTGVADIIANLSRELKVEVNYRENLVTTLERELQEEGIECIHLNIFNRADNQLEINLITKGCPANALCSRVIRPVAEKVCRCRLRLTQRQCALKDGPGECILRLEPAPLFSVTAGGAKQGRNASPISGDNYAVSELGEGRLALILSDGMGVGERAYEESAATINMLEKLLTAGFDAELSLRTVNSILLLRSEEESFATVDLVIFNLYRGEAVFIKGGSCSSLIKRGRQVTMVQTPSLPVGIVKEIRLKTFRHPLRDGELIVMITDGIVGDREEENGWLLKYLKELQSDDPGEVARDILRQAQNQLFLRSDDMAVLVARVERED